MSQSTRAFLSRLPANWPNVEYVLSGKQEVLLAASSPANSAGVGMLLTSTTSAGNITLRSADNVVSPRVYIGWLDSKIDQEIAIAAYPRGRDIAARITALVQRSKCLARMSPLMCRSCSLSERKGPGLYTTAPRRVRWEECGEWRGGGFQGEGVSRDGVEGY
jgi:hypothetical protein